MRPRLAERSSPKRRKKREISSLTKNVGDGAEVSLRRPTRSQERTLKKKNRPASFEMTVVVERCGAGRFCPVRGAAVGAGQDVDGVWTPVERKTILRDAALKMVFLS